jgi:N-acetylglucosaminyl-diphospho-decaprenol L-rhamnosyltransferase
VGEALPAEGAAPDRPDVSVVIVHYRTPNLLEHCLDALAAGSGDLHVETFVVDNGSPGFDEADHRRRRPSVDVIANPTNLGFSHASNEALRRATGRYLLLLNPDAFVGPDTLPSMIAYMDVDQTIGCSTARLELEDGRLDLACRRSFPTPRRSFFRMTLLSRVFPRSRTFAQYNLTYLDEWQEQEIDSPCGAFMLVRREAMRQVGLLDERFFLYGEDLDWALRIKRAGWRITYNPISTVVHLKGASSAADPMARIGYFYEAMRLFYRKHYAPRRSAALNRLMLAAIGTRERLELTAARLRG